MARIARQFLLLLLLLCSGQGALAVPDDAGYKKLSDRYGEILVFTEAEIAASTGFSIPQHGWAKQKIPVAWPPPPRGYSNDPKQTVWARMRFDSASLPGGQIAIYTIDSRERLIIFLNGVDIARNFADENDLALGANHPLQVSVSRSMVRAGTNEIVLRAQRTKRSDVGFGFIAIGSATKISKLYQTQNFWRGLAQAGGSYAMLVLGFLVLFLWFLRRTEPELLFLGLSGIFWFFRNYQFFAGRAYEPFGLFRFISDVSVFVAGSAMISYCVLAMGIPNRWSIVKFVFAIGTVSAIAFTLLWGVPYAQLSVIVACTLAMGVVALQVLKYWKVVPSGGFWPLLFVICVLAVLSIHDMGRMPNVRWWDGLGFLTQPFAGVILFFVFLVVTGRRLVSALGTVEQAKATLESNIALVRKELAASEAARRQMEVESAIASERERLMREMHDGIGSNLVTALAIAQQSKESPRTIATLQRALSDLKITVDSLAPVDGDLVSLLANLRHRMQPDLAEAGLKTIWQVEECPPLPWLDAPSALNMLRIIQEAIGNVLSYAQASELCIGCAPVAHDGRAGVQIQLADNGVGFEKQNTRKDGHGLNNMRQRAHSIGAILTIETAVGNGTTIGLWLPLCR